MRPLLVLVCGALACSSSKSPPAPSPCNDVTCSSHGTCAVLQDTATCICDAGYHNQNATCVEDEPPAVTCVTADDCDADRPFCARGTCCAGACDAPCFSCASDDTGAPNGTCAPVIVGQNPHGDCSAPYACDGAGACFNLGVADPCTADYQCSTGICSTGLCCDADCGGFCRGCDGVDTGLAAGTCGSILEGSDPRNGCAGPLACDGAGACFSGGLGDDCTHGYECATGLCVDGVCCDADCDRACESCDGAVSGGTHGVCAAIGVGLDPETECSDLGCSGDPAIGCLRGRWDSCTDTPQCAVGECVNDICRDYPIDPVTSELAPLAIFWDGSGHHAFSTDSAARAGCAGLDTTRSADFHLDGANATEFSNPTFLWKNGDDPCATYHQARHPRVLSTYGSFNYLFTSSYFSTIGGAWAYVVDRLTLDAAATSHIQQLTVLTGTAGACPDWQAWHTQVVDVLYDGATFYLWYAGHDRDFCVPSITFTMGVATSTDGANFALNGQPLLDEGDNRITGMHPDFARFRVALRADTFWMIYLHPQGLYARSSSDGVHWAARQLLWPATDIEARTGATGSLAMHTLFTDPDDVTHVYFGVGTSFFRIPLNAVLPP